MSRMNRRGRYYSNPNPVNTSRQVSEQQDEMVLRAQQLDERVESGAQCRVRFFNAAAGYGDLMVQVDNKTVSDKLAFGGITSYDMIDEGYQMVTITMLNQPQSIILSKRMPFRNCANTTAAIINTATGIDILMINDSGCRTSSENMACFRVANLSYTSPALDVILENGNPVFEDIRFKQVTEYKQAVPEEYNFNVMLTRETETIKTDSMDVILPEQPVEEGGYPGENEAAYAYFFEEFEPQKRYTAFIIGNRNYEPTLRVETIEAE